MFLPYMKIVHALLKVENSIFSSTSKCLKIDDHIWSYWKEKEILLKTMTGTLKWVYKMMMKKLKIRQRYNLKTGVPVVTVWTNHNTVKIQFASFLKRKVLGSFILRALIIDVYLVHLSPEDRTSNHKKLCKCRYLCCEGRNTTEHW